MSANRVEFGGQATTVIQVGTLNGGMELGQPERRTIRLVPTVTSVVRDRGDEFERLDQWAKAADSGESRLTVVIGSSGIGKTTLAVTWINENQERFKHAMLGMECGGGVGRGRSIEEICDRYIAKAGLGAEGHAVGTLAAKIELVRSDLEGRPAVVVLDDVQSAAQVLSFVSNLPGLLVIVTSRTRLAGLAQHRPVELRLDGLVDEDVAGIFTEILGSERTAAEPEAFTRLVRLCGGVPLVAAHAAGLLFDREDLSIGELAARMAEHGRLATLDEGDEDPMARPSSVFDVSYEELGRDAAAVYQAIGLHPTRDFDAWLIAALFTDSDSVSGEEGLRELRRRGLVKTDLRGRYVMDELTHEHATLMAERHTVPEERRRLSEAIAAYYLYGALAADTSKRWRLSRLYATRAPFPLPDFAAAEQRKLYSDRSVDEPPHALEWIGENLPAIMACMERSGRVWAGDRPAPGYRWQMAEATNAFFTASGRHDERATILAWAEEDALACDDADAQARIQAQWGELLLGQNKVDEAEVRFQRSLSAAESGTERRGIGAALEWLGITERRRGNLRLALRYFERSRDFLDPERKRSFALSYMHTADVYAELGEVDAAFRDYATSMALFREMADEGDRDETNEGKVLAGQAELLVTDRPGEARALFEEALLLFETAHRPHQEGKALEALGDLASARDEADRQWQAALDRFVRVGNAEAAERVRGKLNRD